ncbi:response regulator transcription factor [Olivibacter domesticus]|uniref:Two component transcriptional regulator, LuxR family n=1 Tax=Olivibacter domesticus TaxID=407022 RepID=A0A1H7USC5_OLID1|nr:response regulator transcription factor [Olivibacter domesticus]SEL99890.1 two component transcriptional regulator, LuxR family [Olivibacter domesticus]
MSEKKIQIAVADDQILFRKGLIKLLQNFSLLEVTIEAENGKQLLEKIGQSATLPDVVLLDLSMPEMNGIETTKYLHTTYPDIKILMLSVHDDDNYIVHLLACGASGYLEKNADPEEVLRAITSVVQDGIYFNKKTLHAMQHNLSHPTRKKIILDDPHHDLTLREIEVLELICQELTAAEIADRLSLSVRTIDGHRNNLLRKVGARNTAGLVKFAIMNGIITIQH